MLTTEPDLPDDQPDHGYGADHRRASLLHDWRLKSLIQGVLSRLPASERLNYVLQRRITHTLPIGDAELVGQVGKAARNIAALRRWTPTSLSDAYLYEYGVGWDLVMPLAYWCMGVERQTVIDLSPLARPDLIRDVARRMSGLRSRLRLPRSPALVDADRSARELVAPLGIDYRAPEDARSVDIANGAIDMVSSCDVLEHVPVPQIGPILEESRRVLRDDGIMRLRIDYQDHYWYFDTRISPYNFLGIADAAWRRHNPALHHQNRLRHDDYIGMLTAAGWTVLEDDHPTPTMDDLRAIESIKLARRFRSSPPERLAIRFANLTLRKEDGALR